MGIINETGYLVKTPSLKKTDFLGEEYYSTVLVTNVLVGKEVKVKTKTMSYVVYFNKNLSKEQLSCLMKGSLVNVTGVFGENSYYNTKYQLVKYNYIKVLSFYHIKNRSEIMKDYHEMLKANGLID